MTPRRLFAAVLAASAGALLWLAAPPAAAASVPQLSLNPIAGSPGTQVTATGTGFCPAPCSPVELDYAGAPIDRSVTVAANGSFRVTFTVPANSPGGRVTVYASQSDAVSTRQASTQFQETPSVPASGGTSGAPGHTSSAPSNHPTTTSASTPATTSVVPPVTSASAPSQSEPVLTVAAKPRANGKSTNATPWIIAGVVAAAALTALGTFAWRRRTHT
jgi:hypothetical protein